MKKPVYITNSCNYSYFQLLKKITLYILLGTYLFCLSQLGIVYAFHDQIHKLDRLVSSEITVSGSEQSDILNESCDGDCMLMKNSKQQNENSTDQQSQKNTLSSLSSHNGSSFNFNTEIKSSICFSQASIKKYSAPSFTDPRPPRIS